MLKNASVIISADHGDQVSSHGLKQKGYPFKESENIPFLVYSPELSKELIGTKNNVLGSLLDLNPTFEVLSNSDIKSKIFKCKSLVYRKNNYIYPRSEDITAFQICNSIMHFIGGYFGYLAWKLSLISSDKRPKFLFNPDNLFEIQYSFGMINTKINCKQYKFCRIYSYKQLISTNLAKVSMNKNKLDIKNIYIDCTAYNDLINILPSSFTFNEGLKSIIDEYGNDDNIHIHFYYLLMSEHLVKLKNNIVIIPNMNDNSYVDLKSTNMFMCWDIKDDPHEVYNLCDNNYPQRENVLLFNTLNIKLNNEFNKYEADNFRYAIPVEFIKDLIDNVQSNNKPINNITKEDLFKSLSSFSVYSNAI